MNQNQPTQPTPPLNPPQSQTTQPLNQPSTPPLPNQQPTSSIWKSDAFIILSLVIFWPLGLILMWKYAKWRTWAKGVLTAVFLIAAAPILFLWSLLFGINAYSFVENIANPQVVNQSKLYNCASLNSQWGKCTNSKYNFSFEYPASWNYTDENPEGIGFSPSNKNIRNDFVIALNSPHNWESEQKAKDFAKGFLPRKEITINGLYATKDFKSLSEETAFSTVDIVDGKTVYQFMAIPGNLKKAETSLSTAELQSIFDHMTNSFKIE